MNNVTISSDFKKHTREAILAIVFFIITYLALLGFALALTALCAYVGISIIFFNVGFLTLLVGIGLIAMGGLVLVFLIKFLFKTNKVDRSHLMEIKRSEAPRLFQLLEELVQEVGTDFPKKVYLSSAVNASVFYDSNFWSMFLPIRKNLEIGMGLVNSVSASEFKAVLAHEFGHFSQKSMKVGSYVYHVNQVIFNLLNDDEWYHNILQQWASLGDFFYLSAMGAIKIIQGIQWVLRKVYAVVNLRYLSLSREMEFHADAVAASVTGYEPLKTALLRLELAESSYQQVLNFYGSRINEGIKSPNIFKEHQFVLDYVSEQERMTKVNGFPQVQLIDLDRCNKSKLVIKNQWASHPSTPDRVEALEKLGFPVEEPQPQPANELFENLEDLQQRLTQHLFAPVKYDQKPRLYSPRAFQKAFVDQYQHNSFDPILKGYYDQHNPQPFLLGDEQQQSTEQGFEDIYGPAMIGLVHQLSTLENDIQTLQTISTQDTGIKTFDYDGQKYAQKDAKNLIQRLQQELKKVEGQLVQNDKQVFQYFYQLAQQQQKTETLLAHYQTFFDFDRTYNSDMQLYEKLIDSFDFVEQTTPYEQIERNLAAIKTIEIQFKKSLSELLANTTEVMQGEISEVVLQQIEKYQATDWVYFERPDYHNDNLEFLFKTMEHFRDILYRAYFLYKRDLLRFKAELQKSATKH